MFVTEFVWRQSSCDCVKMSKVQMLSLLVKQRLTAGTEPAAGATAARLYSPLYGNLTFSVSIIVTSLKFYRLDM